MAKRWYVVQTYSGFERRVEQALRNRIKAEGMEDYFGDILIPSEKIVEAKKGKKKEMERSFFPGYLLVEMEMNDKTWHLVRKTPKVTGFVGGRYPNPIPEEEVEEIKRLVAEGKLKPKPRITISIGEVVRVIDGPFASFQGTVEEINEEKGKVIVSVSIFGRPTPVELDFSQIEKS
ncbi:MAG: transcription termination/antitermination protein NusG [Deltaproteobacteria bacterium]|nr:MAG: transcription termination/antitermination protein NusG [Deltaproteobacteria bacterium]